MNLVDCVLGMSSRAPSPYKGKVARVVAVLFIVFALSVIFVDISALVI